MSGDRDVCRAASLFLQREVVYLDFVNHTNPPCIHKHLGQISVTYKYKIEPHFVLHAFKGSSSSCDEVREITETRLKLTQETQRFRFNAKNVKLVKIFIQEHTFIIYLDLLESFGARFYTRVRLQDDV